MLQNDLTVIQKNDTDKNNTSLCIMKKLLYTYSIKKKILSTKRPDQKIL